MKDIHRILRDKYTVNIIYEQWLRIDNTVDTYFCSIDYQEYCLLLYYCNYYSEEVEMNVLCSILVKD